MFYKHKKSGNLYILVGYAKMQARDWVRRLPLEDPRVIYPSVDMAEVAIYISATENNEMWVRPKEEFEERFELLDKRQE